MKAFGGLESNEKTIDIVGDKSVSGDEQTGQGKD